MAVPNRFILHQGKVVAAMGRVALEALMGGGTRSGGEGAVREEVLPPRSADLVRHYVKLVGGDPAAYRYMVPPHLFPQWGFPIAMQSLSGLDYPLFRGLNAGCRLKVRAPMPQDEPLRVRSHLEHVDDDGRRVLLDVCVVTGTKSAPDALEATMTVLVPLGKKTSSGGKERPRVPSEAREVAFRKVDAGMGLSFAKLTGDFNPVHWVPAYARVSGFSSCILHGFASMALAMEGLNKSLFAGDVTRICDFEARFTRPLVLPARVGLYVRDDRLFIGDAPGGPAYLMGRFATA